MEPNRHGMTCSSLRVRRVKSSYAVLSHCPCEVRVCSCMPTRNHNKSEKIATHCGGYSRAAASLVHRLAEVVVSAEGTDSFIVRQRLFEQLAIAVARANARAVQRRRHDTAIVCAWAVGDSAEVSYDPLQTRSSSHMSPGMHIAPYQGLWRSSSLHVPLGGPSGLAWSCFVHVHSDDDPA